MRESKLQAAIRLALAARGDNVFWRNSVGKATYYKGGERCPMCHEPTFGARKFVVPYGLCPGSSDLIGMVPVDVINSLEHMKLGVYVGLEVKTPKGREREEQKLYRELVTKRGGVVEVVRSVQDAHDVIERIKELEPWINRQ
jgi:hypothetical protein